MNKKLIFFDIDGTLVSHAGESHVPEATIEAVECLRKNGHVPAIATARNLALTRKTAVFFGIDLVVCCNGSHVAQAGGGQKEDRAFHSLYEAWLEEEFVRLFLDVVAPLEPTLLPGRLYALDAEHIYIDRVPDFLRAFVFRQAGFDCTRPLSAMKRTHMIALYASLSSQEQRTLCRHENINVVELPGYTEFRPGGVSKWSGIVEAAAGAGFDLEDVVTVGDGLNDIEMIENAGLGVAVGGAKAELKAVADLVTEDIDNGGILSAFRSLGMV
jgi:Cof subfamily protein (haloacid dehalogenase superfamily)